MEFVNENHRANSKVVAFVEVQNPVLSEIFGTTTATVMMFLRSLPCFDRVFRELRRGCLFLLTISKTQKQKPKLKKQTQTKLT